MGFKARFLTPLLLVVAAFGFHLLLALPTFEFLFVARHSCLSLLLAFPPRPSCFNGAVGFLPERLNWAFRLQAPTTLGFGVLELIVPRVSFGGLWWP